MHAQIAEQVIVAGVVDQRAIARLQQIAHDEVQRLTRSLGQQNLGGRRRDADVSQRQREVFAQWQIAERVAIFEQMRAVLARERAEGLTDPGFILPGIGQPRTARKRCMISRLQKAADEPDQLLIVLVRLRSARNGAFGTRSNIEAGASARLQTTHRDEPVIGFDDGEAAHAVGLRESADRG
jgi:hypothetical protein